MIIASLLIKPSPEMTTLSIQNEFAPIRLQATVTDGPTHANLAELKAGDTGVINALGAESELRLRMHALGLLPGRTVQVIRKAPFHGPLEIRSGHTNLLIRLDEARSISLEPQS